MKKLRRYISAELSHWAEPLRFGCKRLEAHQSRQTMAGELASSLQTPSTFSSGGSEKQVLRVGFEKARSHPFFTLAHCLVRAKTNFAK